MSIPSDEVSHSSLPVTTSYSRRLRLVVREEEDCNNLFVRLSSGVASDLRSLSWRQSHDDLPATYQEEPGDAWTLFEEGPNDCISFLPLCICFGGNTSYASYNGGTCVPSSGKGMWFQKRICAFDCDLKIECKRNRSMTIQLQIFVTTT